MSFYREIGRRDGTRVRISTGAAGREARWADARSADITTGSVYTNIQHHYLVHSSGENVVGLSFSFAEIRGEHLCVCVDISKSSVGQDAQCIARERLRVDLREAGDFGMNPHVKIDIYTLKYREQEGELEQ